MITCLCYKHSPSPWPQSADGSQEDGGGAGLREDKAVQCGGGRDWRCGQCDRRDAHQMWHWKGERRSFVGGMGVVLDSEVRGGVLEKGGCGYANGEVLHGR